MRFERIRLENFKCYGDADLPLDRGVTVIHGLNGSGKSSLLEAGFFALYGAKALDKNLNDIVTIGEDETTVELWFSHAGESFHVKRRIRVRNERAKTVEAVLDGPDGTYEGARSVRRRVAELLRMDSEAFVNCAYVRQGEVNKLINASPGDRQDMLDDLLQLGKLEEYRERASKARVGIGRVRDDKQGALSEVNEQIDTKEDKELHEQLNTLQTDLAEVESEVERHEENREEAEETLAEAEGVLEEYKEKQETLADLADDIEALNEKIRETAQEREALADRLTETKEQLSKAQQQRDSLLDATDLDDGDEDVIRESIADLETKTDDITEEIKQLSVETRDAENEAEALEERADELEVEATEKREEATQLEAEVEEGRDLVATRREELEEMETELAGHKEVFAEAPIAVGEAAGHREDIAEELASVQEQRAEANAQLENAEERLAEARRLKEAGQCPECGQPIEDSPHVEAMDERREIVEELEERLEDLREQESEFKEQVERAETLEDHESEIERLQNDLENARQLVDEKADMLDEKGEKVGTLREEADELEGEAAEKREKATEAGERADEYQEQIAEANQQKADLNERIERLESLLETVERIADLQETIEDIRDDRAEKADLNDERRDHLADKREQRAELADQFDEERVEHARAEKQKAEQYLEEVTETLEELESERDELQNEIGRVTGEIEDLEELRERRESLEDTVERLSSLYDEAEQLQEMYATLRAQLRQRNVESLERMLNETFDLVYGNDSYSRLELDGEYRLTVYQKDGETLEPDQLSGGERALFNLSLRCAIYRLLSEGIEGAAPMPPLILDEPTVFLDSGHVSRLVELINSMREMGVEQILVVSHDEELVGAADDLVTVRKDPRTNRSTVEQVESADAAVLGEADD